MIRHRSMANADPDVEPIPLPYSVLSLQFLFFSLLGSAINELFKLPVPKSDAKGGPQGIVPISTSSVHTGDHSNEEGWIRLMSV